MHDFASLKPGDEVYVRARVRVVHTDGSVYAGTGENWTTFQIKQSDLAPVQPDTIEAVRRDCGPKL